MTLSRKRQTTLVGVFVLSLIGLGAYTAFGDDGFLVDDSPSREQQIEDAHERGIEGTVEVPNRATLDPDLDVETFGPYVLVPFGWQGPTPTVEPVDDPAPPAPGAATIEEVRTSDLWREPQYLPDGYTLVAASSPQLNVQIELIYADEAGHPGLTVMVLRPQVRPIWIGTWGDADEGNVFVTGEIEGMRAVFWQGRDGEPGLGVTIRAFDESTGLEYAAQTGPGLTVDEVTEIVKGLRK
ncbi:MAG: hypothetical protein AB7F65_11580 [Dehalococcoidia bacterium]